MKRVATVAVIHDGRILMGMRRDNKRWTSPGGHLEEGEEPLAGGVRELFEESGIRAEPKDLKKVGFKTVTKPDGTKLEVTAFVYEPKERPRTSMRADPDLEVQRWHWVEFGDGLRPDVAAHLHVPLEHNVLLNALGIKAMEKKAFWIGFEKQAIMPSVNPFTGAAAKALGRNAVAGVSRVVRANPLKTLGAGAALGAVGFGAGRASAPN